MPYLFPVISLVEIIYSLVFRRLSAKGETLPDHLKHFENAVAKLSGKHRRLSGCIVLILTRFCTYINNLSLLDNQHALTVCDNYDGAAGDNIVDTMVTSPERGLFLSLCCQNVI